jgi:Lysyl oxidase
MRLGRAKLSILLASGMLLVVSGFGAVGARAMPEDPAATSLSLGQGAIWTGPFVDRARVPDSSLCGVAGPCWTYPLDVAAGSPRLRVAIGTKDPSNDYTLELLDPSGAVVATGSNGDFPGEHYAAELFAAAPHAGTWTMRVIPENVVSGAFEARAKLEAPPGSTGAAGAHSTKKCKRKGKRSHRGKRRKPCRKKKKLRPAAASSATAASQLLPNLRVDPPWEVGFRAPLPATPPGPLHLSAFMTELGIHGTDAELAGLNPDSCSYDETIESTLDTHCLRFSTGIPNFGDGAFTIWGTIDPTDPEGDGELTGPLDQRIYNSDGTYADVRAGGYQFHPIHFHLHVTNLAEFRLFRVVGDQLSPNGSMVEMGQGLKEGFCLVNVKMATFTQFIQGVPNPQGDCLPAPDGGELNFTEEITRGWEDVYDWQTPGQYIDFENNPDGIYVIQMKINTQGQFRESNYSDDVGYTLIRVTGDTVQTLERGRGEGPFDPNKQVLDPVMSW